MSTENVPNKPKAPCRILPLIFGQRKKILGLLMVLCAVGAFLFAREGWRKFQLRCARNNFPSLSEATAAVEIFSHKYNSMPIGALVSFAHGNSLSQSGDWDKAAAIYGRCGQLKSARLDGVASIAEAICLFRTGNISSAERLLFNIGEDDSQTNSVRAAAYYFRALIANENGQRNVATASLEAMEQLKECGPWLGRAALLSLSIR
ncbi:MAG: hypothetical protein LBB38_04220 [Puniceicoccales bacterium]|jgi:hypothetical protein|nr:hypothetical protein [Puniceicoccales bacterium]